MLLRRRPLQIQERRLPSCVVLARRQQSEESSAEMRSKALVADPETFFVAHRHLHWQSSSLTQKGRSPLFLMVPTEMFVRKEGIIRGYLQAGGFSAIALEGSRVEKHEALWMALDDLWRIKPEVELVLFLLVSTSSRFNGSKSVNMLVVNNCFMIMGRSLLAKPIFDLGMNRIPFSGSLCLCYRRGKF
ncbi:hypothetical protein ACLOJK_030199 [Asimina triloba]